jgi:hypothetical protein
MKRVIINETIDNRVIKPNIFKLPEMAHSLGFTQNFKPFFWNQHE